MTGADQYLKSCSICHLEDGSGVPGAFPPLDQRIGQWSMMPEGRNYLISVLLYGLNGRIVVGTYKYNGVMPAMASQLESAKIATILNYIVNQFSPVTNLQLFTSSEVDKLRGPNNRLLTLDMRPTPATRQLRK